MKSIRNKAILIFIVCSSIITKGYCGDSTGLNKSNRYIVGVAAGPALPFLHFGTPGSAPSTSRYDSSFYGYAKIGFHFGINAEVFITPHFGFIGLMSGNFNSFNSTVYNNNILYNETVTASVKANGYYTGEYMVGFLFNDPFKEKNSNLSWVFLLTGGYITTSFPTIVTTFSASPNQSAGESSLSANSGHSFVGDISFGLHDKISDHIVVSMDISFSFTYMSFSSGVFMETIQGAPSISTTPGNPLNMGIGLFKPTLGVGYIF